MFNGLSDEVIMIISGTLISFSIYQFNVSQLVLYSTLEHAWFYVGFTNGEAMTHFFTWRLFFFLLFAFHLKAETEHPSMQVFDCKLKDIVRAFNSEVCTNNLPNSNIFSALPEEFICYLAENKLLMPCSKLLR